MALLKIIKSGKSKTALKNVLRYVLRNNNLPQNQIDVQGDILTTDTDYLSLHEEFKRVQALFDKKGGKQYKHLLLSFHKDDKIATKEAMEFAKELMEKIYPTNQCVFALHSDTGNLHIHMIVSSVDFLDGHKIQQSKRDLENYKKLVDQMCKERGLSVIEKGKDYYGNDIASGTIISEDKNKYHVIVDNAKKSYMVDCVRAVLESKKYAVSKEDFIYKMSKKGWDVCWTEKRKYIVFENQKSGKKVRDANLSKTFSLNIGKEALINEFGRNITSRRNEGRTEGKFGNKIDIGGNIGESGDGKSGKPQKDKRDGKNNKQNRAKSTGTRR